MLVTFHEQLAHLIFTLNFKSHEVLMYRLLWKVRKACKILIRKPEDKKHGWGDNVKIVHREVGWGCLDLTRLAKDGDRWRALVNKVTNLQIPCKAGNFLTSLATITFLLCSV